MKTKVENFGCRLNALEGDAIAQLIAPLGETDAPLIVINGCAVTGEAMRQTRQAARRAKRKNPNGRVIVSGCAAQTDPASFAKLAEVDLVLGNREKLDIASYTDKTNSKIKVSDIMQPQKQSAIFTPQKRQRAFVQVQSGCDHRCTFCIIPFGRGNSQSVAASEVIAQCRQLVKDGHKEIILSGVDLTSYASSDAENQAENLGELVAKILAALPELPRLRLSSVDAIELDETLIALFRDEPRLCAHLHLSLQSGDDLILKRMARRHQRIDALELCARLRKLRPDFAFTADFIAGFPTESEAAFQNSCELIRELNLAHTHIFPFSPRPDTPAARMPQVKPAIIKSRAKIMREVAAATSQNWRNQQIGKSEMILLEKKLADNYYEGRGENFARIKISNKNKSKDKIGDLLECVITAAQETYLIAERI